MKIQRNFTDDKEFCEIITRKILMSEITRLRRTKIEYLLLSLESRLQGMKSERKNLGRTRGLQDGRQSGAEKSMIEVCYRHE